MRIRQHLFTLGFAVLAVMLLAATPVIAELGGPGGSQSDAVAQPWVKIGTKSPQGGMALPVMTSPGVVASLGLPKGNFLVTAKLFVSTTANAQSAGCHLTINGQTGTTLEDYSFGAAPVANQWIPLEMTLGVSLGSPSKAVLSCGSAPAGGRAWWVKISALKVMTLQNVTMP
jgi:hypothetical protein